jgi:hypothetical protein
MKLVDTLPAACVAVACAVGAVVYASRPRAKPTPPAVTVVAPELGGLKAGDRIAGWNVATMTTERDGAIAVTMSRDGVEFTLTIAPLGVRGENPPYVTKTHAMYYGHTKPPDARIPAGAMRAITAELMRRMGPDGEGFRQQ